MSKQNKSGEKKAKNNQENLRLPNLETELQKTKSSPIASISGLNHLSKEELGTMAQSCFKSFGVRDFGVVVSLMESALYALGKYDDYKDEDLSFIFNYLKESKPRGHLEVMLHIQMMATHAMSCKCFYRSNLLNQTAEGMSENINRATKLTRTYVAQMDALKKYRSKGGQKITVEHINVNDGGKAIIGTVNTQINNQLSGKLTGGGKSENEK